MASPGANTLVAAVRHAINSPSPPGDAPLALPRPTFSIYSYFPKPCPSPLRVVRPSFFFWSPGIGKAAENEVELHKQVAMRTKRVFNDARGDKVFGNSSNCRNILACLQDIAIIGEMRFPYTVLSSAFFVDTRLGSTYCQYSVHYRSDSSGKTLTTPAEPMPFSARTR